MESVTRRGLLENVASGNGSFDVYCFREHVAAFREHLEASDGEDLSMFICLNCIKFAFRLGRTRISRFRHSGTVSDCKIALIRSHLYTPTSSRRVAFATSSLSSSHCSISILQYGVSFEFGVDQVGLVNLYLSELYQNCISPWSYSHFSISAFVHGFKLQIGFVQVSFVHSDVSAPCSIRDSVSVTFYIARSRL